VHAQPDAVRTHTLVNTPAEQVADFWHRKAEDINRRPEGAEFLVLVDSSRESAVSVVSPHITHW